MDWHSEGLILLTNDGAFATQITQQKVSKTYLVKLNGQPTIAQLTKLKKGVSTEVGRLKALHIQLSRKRTSRHSVKTTRSWVTVVINEGRNRQLHRMFEKIGFQIKVLRRIAIGKLKLKSLRPGEYFILSSSDINKIFSVPKN